MYKNIFQGIFYEKVFFSGEIFEARAENCRAFLECVKNRFRHRDFFWKKRLRKKKVGAENSIR